MRNREGKALTWFILDGEKETRVDVLTEAQKSFISQSFGTIQC